MTMDRTLKSSGSLKGARSVLTRDERIEHMLKEGRFDPDENSPFGLPKIKQKQSKAGTKNKKAEEEAPVEAAEDAEGNADAASKS